MNFPVSGFCVNNKNAPSAIRWVTCADTASYPLVYIYINIYVDVRISSLTMMMMMMMGFVWLTDIVLWVGRRLQPCIISTLL